jgi:hypothetical protein
VTRDRQHVGMRSHELPSLCAGADVAVLVHDDAVDYRLPQLECRHHGVAENQCVSVAQPQQHRQVTGGVPGWRNQPHQSVAEDVDGPAEALERLGPRDR